MLKPFSHRWLNVMKEAGVEPEITPLAKQFMIYLPSGTLSAIVNLIDHGKAYEPHLQWMPWISKRQIYKALSDLLDYLTKIKAVIVYTRFFQQFDAWAARGKFRKVGFLETGGIHIYEAVKQ